MPLTAPQNVPARPSEEAPLPEFELNPAVSRRAGLAVVVVFGLSGLAWAAIVWAVATLLG